MNSRFEIDPFDIQEEEFTPPAPRLVVVGDAKIGKTTFASKSPNPIFIVTESGAEGVRVPRLPRKGKCESWNDVLAAMQTTLKTEHDRKTVVLDTIDNAYNLCEQMICQRDFDGRWDKFHHYAKGPRAASKEFGRLLNAMDLIRDKRGMNVIVLSHKHIHKGASAYHEDFQVIGGKVHNYSWADVRDWADQIGHATSEMRVRDGKAKARSRERWLVFEPEPARDAGCRAGYEIPMNDQFSDSRIKLDWNEYQHTMGDIING